MKTPKPLLALRMVFPLAASLIVLLLGEGIARGSLSADVFASFIFPHIGAYLLAWLLLFLVWLLLDWVFRCPPLSTLGMAVLGCAPCAVNFYTLQLRGEPFLPWDLTQVSEAAGVASAAGLKIQPSMVVTIIVVLVLMAAMTCLQTAFPELMLSAVKLTVITLMMYFIVENPVGTYHDRAMIDLPTGLRNHNALQEDAVNLANNWQLSSNGSIGVVACDLNDLKRINDTHGHQAGDEAIALIGRVLRTELVSAYGVYRTGGDEFTAIYVNQHEDVMIAEMQAARDNLRSRHLDCGWAVHAALGSAYATSQSELSIRDIMQRADEAMYADKARQKGAENVRR